MLEIKLSILELLWSVLPSKNFPNFIFLRTSHSLSLDKVPNEVVELAVNTLELFINSIFPSNTILLIEESINWTSSPFLRSCSSNVFNFISLPIASNTSSTSILGDTLYIQEEKYGFFLSTIFPIDFIFIGSPTNKFWPNSSDWLNDPLNFDPSKRGFPVS